MMGTIYSIYLEKPNSNIDKIIKANWPRRNYVASSTLYFIAPHELITTNDIRQILQNNENLKISPSVIISEVVSLGGYFYPSLWEWKRKILS